MDFVLCTVVRTELEDRLSPDFKAQCSDCSNAQQNLIYFYLS